ncbi:MAG TPA: hypothetical protein VNS46_18205 [Nocardioides sp.]|nr:hypothetical protein [Nocardioides sp.]
MDHTPAWRVATLLMALLGLCQLWWARGLGDHTSVSSAVLAPLSLLSALALSRANVLETRLPVVVTAAAQIGVTTLALTVGLPGQDRHVLDVPTSVALVVAFGVLVAIDADRRARTSARAASAATGSPYAR